jgi:hypothetical protein
MYENLGILGRYDQVVSKWVTIHCSGCLIFIKIGNFSTQLNSTKKSQSSLSFNTIDIINDSFCGSAALVGLGHFTSSLIYTQSVGLL